MCSRSQAGTLTREESDTLLQPRTSSNLNFLEFLMILCRASSSMNGCEDKPSTTPATLSSSRCGKPCDVACDKNTRWSRDKMKGMTKIASLFTIGMLGYCSIKQNDSRNSGKFVTIFLFYLSGALMLYWNFALCHIVSVLNNDLIQHSTTIEHFLQIFNVKKKYAKIYLFIKWDRWQCQLAIGEPEYPQRGTSLL